MRSSVRALINEDGGELIFGQLVDAVKGCILIKEHSIGVVPLVMNTLRYLDEEVHGNGAAH